MRALILPFLYASFLPCGLAACGSLDEGGQRVTSRSGGTSGGEGGQQASGGGTSRVEGGQQAVSGSGGAVGTDEWILKSDEEIEAQFPCDEGSQRVGDVELRSLADVEALAGVSEVVGTLHISDAASDLRPLYCLRAVTEDLRIYDTIGLRNLAGLEGLTVVRGGIDIGRHCSGNRRQCSGNRDLESVLLPRLELAGWVGVGASCGGEGGPYCGPNAALTYVQMNRLEEVSNIYIGSNPVLEEARFESAAELVRLSVGGPALRSLSLPQLRLVDDLLLGGAPALEEVIAENLEVTGSVRIGGTDLRDLSWLRAKSLVTFDSTSNPQLTNLGNLQQLEEVELLTLKGNQALTSLHGLEQLKSAVEVTISSNPQLTSLQGLEHLEEVVRPCPDA